MSDTETIKLPLWAVGLIVGILGAVLTGVVYVVETHALAVANAAEIQKLEQDQKERFDRIENGVDQIWGHVMDAGLNDKKAGKKR